MLAAAAMLHADIPIPPAEAETCQSWLQDMLDDACFKLRAQAIDVLAGMDDVWTEVSRQTLMVLHMLQLSWTGCEWLIEVLACSQLEVAAFIPLLCSALYI